MSEILGYPVLMRLEGQCCLVIGGGRVATRKVTGLLEAGAKVVVVSPQLDETLARLADDGRIQTQQCSYTPGILAALQPRLVFAATNSAEVNLLVVDEARALHVMANVADDGSRGDFSNMAAVRRGNITVAIATGGASPALASHLKTRIESVVGAEYAQLAQWLTELRPLVRSTLKSNAARENFWHSVVSSPILEHLRQGNQILARAELDQLWAEAEQTK